MFQRYVVSKMVSTTRKLYILVGITLPLTASTIILALAENNLLFASAFSIASLSWSVVALNLGQKVSRCKDTGKACRVVEEASRHKREKRFAKTASFLILLLAIVFLVGVIIYGSHLYFALAALWCIIVNGSEFVFVSVLTDPSYSKKK